MENKIFDIETECKKGTFDNGIKGGVYLEACFGILAPKFRFYVWMTWKINSL